MWTLTEASSAGLDNRLARFAHDVYHRATFHEYDHANGHGEICQYWYEDARGALLHTFMLRRIHKVGSEHISAPLFDAETVRGAAGPLATSLDDEFLADAWQHYHAWCEKKRVVAEYVRFNPFIHNARVARRFFDVRIGDLIGVVVDLSVSEDERWATQYDGTQRKNVRKAKRLGVTCQLENTEAAFATFSLLQKASWSRLGVPSERQYTEACLQLLRAQFGKAAPLFTARIGSKLVAAALFLSHGETVHYQLSARDPTFGNTGATNLILHTAMRWAQRNSFKKLHLGTGRTAGPKDELLRFKRCLSPERVTYSYGARYHLPNEVGTLCALWQRQALGQALGSTSMPYREPLPAAIKAEEASPVQ